MASFQLFYLLVSSTNVTSTHKQIKWATNAKMADHLKKISKGILKWWPYMLFVCNLLRLHFASGTPIPIDPLQLPDYPQQIHYVGDRPLPGGKLQSMLHANFTPDQIVTGSGVPTNPAFSGTAGGFSLLGNAIAKVGNALGSALGTAVKGIYANMERKKPIYYII